MATEPTVSTGLGLVGDAANRAAGRLSLGLVSSGLGLDIESALKAAGAGGETSLQTAMSLGEAVYRELTRAA